MRERIQFFHKAGVARIVVRKWAENEGRAMGHIASESLPWDQELQYCTTKTPFSLRT
jgi:hypothetical protein